MSAPIRRLRELLNYDTATGLLTWRVSRGKAKAGSVVSTRDVRGYLVLGVDGKRYYAHRVAWALMSGDWPAEVIDHIDGDKANNRAANLRCVPISMNAQNRRRVAVRSKSQILGVRKYGARWRAVISISGSQKYLGTFDSAAEAQQAYLAAKRSWHAGCTI